MKTVEIILSEDEIDALRACVRLAGYGESGYMDDSRGKYGNVFYAVLTREWLDKGGGLKSEKIKYVFIGK